MIDTVDEANSSSSNLPDCWSANQRDKFLKDNDWLTVNIGSLGCRVCSALATHPACTITLSKGWVEGIIIPYGHSKEARQTSLRKKIFDHRTSEAHERAVKQLNEQKGDALKLALANAARHQFDETCKVFRTALLYSQAGSALHRSSRSRYIAAAEWC